MDDADSRGTGSLTVEMQLEELEKVLEQLEDEATPLGASFSLYERGMALVKEINSRIDRVEKQMIILEGQEDE